MTTEYYIAHGAMKHGPFSLEQLAGAGLTAESMVWHPGMANWARADNVPDLLEVVAGLPPPLPKATFQANALPQSSAPPLSPREQEWQRVRRLGKLLFRLHNLVAIYVAVWLLVSWLVTSNPLWVFLANIPVAILISQIADCMNWNRVVWTVFGYLPFINIVTIIIVSRQATERLKSVGARIGFLGPVVPAEPPEAFQCGSAPVVSRGSP